MKRFFSQVALFVIISLACGLMTEAFIYIQMRNRRAHIHEDWPDIANLDVDYLIVGDSRSSGHLIPSVIDSITGMKGYNIAYDGYRVKMGLNRLRYCLENATVAPQYVLIQSDLSYMADSRLQSNYPMKDGVLRYFWLDQLEINQFYESYENWRQTDAWIPMLRYKGYPLIFAKHVLGWNRWDKRPDQGYWHLTRSVGFHGDESKPKSTEKLNYFHLLDLQNEFGFTTVGFIPPSPASRWRPEQSAIDSLQKQFEILDHSNLFQESESQYFYDKSHFSKTGAIEYSTIIGKELLKRHRKGAIQNL